MSKLKEAVVDLIWAVAPAIDQEYAGIAAHYFEGLEEFPGVTAIDPKDLIGAKILFLLPLIDREIVKLLTFETWDPFGGDSNNRASLDPYQRRGTGSRSSSGQSRGVRSGVQEVHQNIRHEYGQKTHNAAKSFYKVFLVLIPIIFLLGGFLLFTGYGEYVGEEVGDQYIPSLATSAEGPIRVYQQAKGRVFCLLKGPSCLRQYRLNETTRPGSNEVGQTYGLKIDRFQVGQGDQLNIAYRDADYPVPISFTISNPRHGLKGINARNVEYRIRLIDTERDRTNPYCDTGWINITNAYDADGDDRTDDIFPGTSASTGFLTITSDGSEDSVDAPGDGITLQDCEMLQPALGSHRTALLNVKYDYFSQATLYFDAMSQENFQSNPNIEKSWKESETADTPVKAAVNVNDPVLFSETTGETQQFGVRATLNTGKNDVEYQVNDLIVRNSDYVQRATENTCQFENTRGNRNFGPGDNLVPNDGVDGARAGIQDDNMFTPESESGAAAPNSARANLIAGSADRAQGYYWFSSSKNPPIVGCVMELSETQSINPQGETLTMGVAANYTVSKRYSLGSFEALNSRCSRMECPMIVTSQANASVSDYNFKTTCDGLDAGNGCSIVEADLENWGSVGTQDGQPSPLNHRIDGDQGRSDDEIESGEIATEIQDQVSESGDSSSGETYYAGIDKNSITGIGRDYAQESNKQEPSYSSLYHAIVHYRTYEGEYDVEVEQLSVSECEDGINQFKQNQARQEMDVLDWNCGTVGPDAEGGSWVNELVLRLAEGALGPASLSLEN